MVVDRAAQLDGYGLRVRGELLGDVVFVDVVCVGERADEEEDNGGGEGDGEGVRAEDFAECRARCDGAVEGGGGVGGAPLWGLFGQAISWVWSRSGCVDEAGWGSCVGGLAAVEEWGGIGMRGASTAFGPERGRGQRSTHLGLMKGWKRNHWNLVWCWSPSKTRSDYPASQASQGTPLGFKLLPAAHFLRLRVLYGKAPSPMRNDVARNREFRDNAQLQRDKFANKKFYV